MTDFDLNMTIGDSVTHYPGLASTYMTYGVDFCCGGDRSVLEAIKDAKASSEEVIQAIEAKLAAIEASGDSTVKLASQSSAWLIDHIISQHHRLVRRILPEASAYLFKLIEVHGENHHELFKVHQLVGALRIELEAHLIKEEKVLFPMILGQREGSITETIKDLEDDHDGAGDVLKALNEITDHYALPQDACATYKLTYGLLQTLEADMYQHVHTENNILFKRF